MRMDRRQKLAYAAASEEIGLTEIPGAVDEPRIVEMFAKAGHSYVKDDETAWCAAAMGAWLEEAGLPSTRKLNARSYLDWGQPVNDPEPGDVVVFWRGSRDGWQGHVAFYVDESDDAVKVLGGNQRNQVNVMPYSKGQVLGYRRYPARNEYKPSGLAALISRLFSFLGKGGPA